ncbi:MAG: glutamate 5-kinase [Actinomycetota bacterium]
MAKARPSGAGRIVLKLGTSTLTAGSGEPDRKRLSSLCRQVGEIRSRGVAATIVSSGAIASGMGPLGLKKRPSDMPTLQAAAAVGQRRLMDLYAEFLEPMGIPVAQVLLTQYDMVQRRNYVNARNTLEKLLELGAVPVVNENDTVAVEEIRYGDNDRLAALVANLVRADLLVMLSDVEGVYTEDPRRKRAELISSIPEITPQIMKAAARGRSSMGSGGMASKLDAARIATLSGVGVIVASGDRPEVLTEVWSGEEVGTYFPPRRGRAQARKLWIAWAPGVRGKLVVDKGAAAALTSGNKSLLAAGVTSVQGDFKAGDAVEIVGPAGEVIGKGLAGLDSDLATRVAGSKGRELIHRDQLVVF